MPMFRAVPGQWLVDRRELTPSTDPAGLRTKCQLTTAHQQIQKDLKDHSAQLHSSQMGTQFQRGLRKNAEGRGLSSFLLLYSTPRFPQTWCSGRAGQALGAGAGPQAGSPGFGQGSYLTRGS